MIRKGISIQEFWVFRMLLVNERKINCNVLGSISLVDKIIQSIIVLWWQVEPILDYYEWLLGVWWGKNHTLGNNRVLHMLDNQ